jgi:hypothetical protein
LELLDPSPATALVAAGGGTIAATLTWALYDTVQRVLSPRERIRVGAVIGYATQQAWQNLMSGDNPRQDGFFESEWPGGRCASEEIAEAAIRAAQQEPEERKIEYIGYLLGNVGFESCAHNRASANHVVRLADSLSYTQLQLLALVHRRDEIRLPPGGPNLQGTLSWDAASIAMQYWDLAGVRALISAPRPDPRLVSVVTSLGPPRETELAPFGLELVELMNLDRMPQQELTRVADALWETASPGSAPGATDDAPHSPESWSSYSR